MNIDQRAREAGAQLRRWDPDLPEEAPHELVGGVARRRRTTRLAVAAAGLVVVVGAGVALSGDAGGRPVETAPATEDGRDQHPDPAPPVEPTTTVPPVPPSSAIPTTAPPVSAGPETCTGALPSGASYSVEYPAGWSTNEGPDPFAGCTHFAPGPLEFTDYDPHVGYASNTVVSFGVAMSPGPYSWEESLVVAETSEYPPGNPEGLERLSVERITTPRGDTALREEFRSHDGHWVRWSLLVDGLPADAVGYERPGVPFEEAAAAVDALVESVQVEG